MCKSDCVYTLPSLKINQIHETQTLMWIVFILYVSDAIPHKTGSYANFHCFFLCDSLHVCCCWGLESSQHADILSFIAKQKKNMQASESMLRLFVVKWGYFVYKLKWNAGKV